MTRTDPEPITPAEGTAAEVPETRKVVARRNELGRPVETVEAESVEAAIHWNADLWEPLR